MISFAIIALRTSSISVKSGMVFFVSSVIKKEGKRPDFSRFV